MEPGGAMAKTW